MTACKYASSTTPRVLPNRHDDGCEDEGCRGCLACTERHCRSCGMPHVEGTNACAGCLEEARTNLAEIERMTAALPDEVAHRGVEGEAMNLLGPVSDPEARQHWEASVLAGRITPVDCEAHELDEVTTWLETADDERHPLLVIGTWSMTYRDAFDHDEPSGRVVLADEIGYLRRNLTYIGSFEWVPFEDFARDLRRCVAHLEAVLHDGEQVEKTRVTCISDECKRRPQLERTRGIAEHQDRWKCPSCDKVYDQGDYLDAHARQLKHKGSEKYLPLREAVSTLVAQGRPERTIRKWLAPSADPEAVVGGFCEIGSHRVWVWWPHLWTLHNNTKTRNRNRVAA